MVYKNFNYTIVSKALLLVLLSIGGVYFYLHANWGLLIVCAFFILITIYNLVDYFNSINRKLSFFFDSIRNEDSSLHFPENVKSGSLKNLNKSLNHLNGIISNIKIKNEHKERFFLEFMKHSTTGLMAIDEKGYIEIVNDAAMKLFNTRILVHIERLKQVNFELYDAITSLRNNQSKTIKVLVDDELHIVLIKMVKLKFGDREFNIYSLGDIKTELDEKEMETWQKLIRILTHEIMNSIAPISSISDTMLNYFKKDKKVSARELDNMKHGLDVINERSKGLMHFVENYRKLTKLPKPVFKPIAVAEWLESVRVLFEERASKDGVLLDIQNDYKGKSFLGDQKLLTQVVINLMNNAADALVQNSVKKVDIQITGSEQESMSMKFTDNGPGISQEDLDQIFMPFFTTKENGSGIGLSLSRQIMKLHRGQLSARSVPGKETVFEMKI